MKSKRINWKQKAINKLTDPDVIGMTHDEAVTYYNRVYRNALKAIGGKQKDFKVSREVYATLFYRGTNVFQLGYNQSITLNPIITDTTDVKKDVTMARMEAFFDKYKDSKYIKETKQLYESGEIDQKEFNERIKYFKNYNPKFLISGS